MAKRLCVQTQKGGGGKTTTALCLAVGCAWRGMRVLLVDSDPQGNAGWIALGAQEVEGATLAHVLLDKSPIFDAVYPTRIENLDVIPAGEALADTALALADEMAREFRLKRALAEIDADYDLIIVDTAPQMSLIQVNVLAAVHQVIVPVDGIFGLSGLSRLEGTIDQVQKYLENPALRIAGLLITRAHANKATREVEQTLRAAYGALVYQTVIPHSTKVEEAHARALTVLEYDRASKPAQAYLSLLDEVLNDGKQPKRTVPGRDTDSTDAAA